MLLIGQYDSPFVRRVGIALTHYGIPFQHEAYSVFRDAEAIAAYNPLRKVPTLVLDDGTVITESSLCLDVIDRMACDLGREDWPELLLPLAGRARTQALAVCGLALGAMEKAVSLVYETQLRNRVFEPWLARCTTQVRETLLLIERHYRGLPQAFLLGDALSHTDVAVTCLLTFIDGAYPRVGQDLALNTLRTLQSTLEADATFRQVWQAFDIPEPRS
jgi:glutathione S-transferase